MKGPRSIANQKFRDEVAFAFMQSVFNKAASAEDVVSQRQGISAAAYAIADAMLEARGND